MQAKLAFDHKYAPIAGREKAGTVAKTGTVIDHPQAYLLVLQGAARPHDQECRERCCRACKLADGDLDAEVEFRVSRYKKVHKGIHPDDYEAFDSGEMVGYDPATGEKIPGPNAEYDGPLEGVK